jgi:tetratricopeptide (TPR) repeat protein
MKNISLIVSRLVRKRLLIIPFLICLTACESTLSREFNLLMSTRDYARSEQLLLNKLQTNPDHAESNYLLGFLYAEQRQFAKAMLHFDRSEKSFSYREHIAYIKERNYNIEFSKGIDSIEKKNPNQAILHFQNATALNPSAFESFLMLGIAQSISGKSSDGIISLTTCLELNPKSYECTWNLSKLYYSAGNYSRSVQILDDFLNHTPNNPQLIWIKINNHLESGDISRAERSFQELRMYFMSEKSLLQSVSGVGGVVQQSVDFASQSLIEYIKQFGFRLYELKIYDRSVVYLNESVSRFPSDIQLRRTLNLAAFYAEEYKILAESGQKLLEQIPGDKPTQAQLLIALEKTGDIDKLRVLQSMMERVER